MGQEEGGGRTAKLETAEKEEDETKAAVIEAEAKKAELERQVAEAEEKAKGTDADRAAAAELAEEQGLVDEAEASSRRCRRRSARVRRPWRSSRSSSST